MLEMKKGLDALLMTPPGVKREVHFLVMTVHRVEDLPCMDKSVMGITKVRETLATPSPTFPLTRVTHTDHAIAWRSPRLASMRTSRSSLLATRPRLRKKPSMARSCWGRTLTNSCGCPLLSLP